MKIPVMMLVAMAAVGCASAPNSGYVFSDVESKRPAVMVVEIEHRIAEADVVAAECRWRNRVAGNGDVKMHPVSPACSWKENGKKIVLCTNPKSFNNAVALEACGHEAFHFHEVVDHK